MRHGGIQISLHNLESTDSVVCFGCRLLRLLERTVSPRNAEGKHTHGERQEWHKGGKIAGVSGLDTINFEMMKRVSLLF